MVVPLCGGNIDTTMLGRVIDRGLAADGRLIRFTATVSDRPGGIAALTALLYDHGASIKVRRQGRRRRALTAVWEDAGVRKECVCVWGGSRAQHAVRWCAEPAN